MKTTGVGEILEVRRLQLPTWPSGRLTRMPRNSMIAIGDRMWLLHLRSGAIRIIHHDHFESVMGLLLTLNALILGVQTDYLARSPEVEEPPAAFRILEMFFCAAFTVEVSLRIFARGGVFFNGPGWRWNVFDFAVVMLQLIEELIKVLNFYTGAGQFGNTPILRLLRGIRLVRVLRFARLLRMIRELHTMVISIMTSMRSFFWTGLLLFMMVYVVGIYFTQSVVEYIRSNPTAYEDHDSLDRYWGSLGSSMLSLFQAMSGGLDWDDLLHPLRTTHGPYMALIFSIYIAFATLVILNLVTGIFVQSAQENLRHGRDLELVNRVRELFMETDSDFTGSICLRDFEQQLSNPHMIDYLRAIDLHPTEARLLFSLLDADDTGEVNSEDFVNGLLRLRGSARAIDQALIQHNAKAMYHALSKQAEQIDSQINSLAFRLQPQPPQMSSPARLRASGAAGLSSHNTLDHAAASLRTLRLPA